jgi:hypothetical protein
MAVWDLWPLVIGIAWTAGGLWQAIRGGMTLRHRFVFWGGSQRIMGATVVVWGVSQLLLGLIEIGVSITLLASSRDHLDPLGDLRGVTFGLVSAYMLIMLPFTLAVHYVTHDQMKIKSKRKPKIKNDGIYEDAN